MLNSLFDLYNCEHLTYSDPYPDGCVLIFNGGNDARNGMGEWNAERMNHAVEGMAWVIFVNIGDESSEFPNHLLQHKNSRLWLQTPLPGQKANRYLIEGYPCHTENMNLPKDLDYFFAGQVTHERRYACLEALEKIKLPSLVLKTKSFGSGWEQLKYLEYMNRAKIVPCPSGPTSPDTFRIWEALECGAIPIVDMRSIPDTTIGFWQMVLGENPLPMIDDWATLPQVMDVILEDYEYIHRLTQYWWKQYKLRFRDSLGHDLISLGA